jgi:NTE family protein
MDDAHRVVFGRADAPRTDVATAVGASSAIPGYFAPVTIHGRRYVDGGVHSPTNADVLRREQLDLVIVSSPMSISRRAGIGPPSWAPRRHFRTRLGQEVRRLRRTGTEVLTFQPGADDLAVMGRNAMDPDRLARVAEQVHASTLRRLSERPPELLRATPGAE